MAGSVKDVRSWIADASRVTVLTGAGISTDSGIPDFRGPNGVWTKNPKAERLSSLDAYVSDPEVRLLAWQSRRDHPMWTAEPNDAHRALVTLERSGRLAALVTQNIDGLHQKAGNSPEVVVELHGTMSAVECLTCADRTTMGSALERVDAGESDPPCLVCGGILKSATISFGQNLRAEVLERAVEAAIDAEVLVVIGSSLGVHPANGLVGIAAKYDARVAIVNATETPYDEMADAVIREPIGEVVPALVSGL
jgi:NAD-dependent deacetylase